MLPAPSISTTNSSDLIIEHANDGNDIVYTSVDYTIGTDMLVGNSGANNVLDGKGAHAYSRPAKPPATAINDFDGNGIAAGDHLSFVGFGASATFSQLVRPKVAPDQGRDPGLARYSGLNGDFVLV